MTTCTAPSVSGSETDDQSGNGVEQETTPFRDAIDCRRIGQENQQTCASDQADEKNNPPGPILGTGYQETSKDSRNPGDLLRDDESNQTREPNQDASSESEKIG
jgi:hypothetical protein